MLRKSFSYLMVTVLLIGVASAFAQKQKKRPVRKKARVEDTRVYLVHADVLHFD